MDQNESPPKPQITQRPVSGGSPLKRSAARLSLAEGTAPGTAANADTFAGEEQYDDEDVGAAGTEGSTKPEIANTHLKSQAQVASEPQPRAALRKLNEPYDEATEEEEEEYYDDDYEYPEGEDPEEVIPEELSPAAEQESRPSESARPDENAQDEGSSAGDVTSLLGVDGATGDNNLNDIKRDGSASSKGSQGSQPLPISPPVTTVYNASVDNENGSIKSNNSDEASPKASKSGSNFSGSHDDGGIQVFKNDLGAISFRIPGKVTHKTTIKLAHYPQPGTEIINIEGPPPCMPPPEECPMPLPECEFGGGGEEVCFVQPEEDPNACCVCPCPAGNFTNNCNFCTYNVGQSDQVTSCDPNGGGYGVSNYPSPYTLMQHSLHMQQQIQHQRMQQQRQQYQQLSQSYFSAFNANNIFRQYYPGVNGQSIQQHQNGYGYGGYNHSQAFRGLGHGQGRSYGHGGC